MYSAFLMEPKQEKPKEKLIEEYEHLEFQMVRLQNNLKDIAKQFQIIAVDQTKDNSYVIIYSADDGKVCRFMAHSCDKAFEGHWEFSIHATYSEQGLHIDDMRGAPDQGFGSICMKHLKEYAENQNKARLTGKLARRDWDHADRLIHFYKKHDFHVEVNEEKQSGFIVWESK